MSLTHLLFLIHPSSPFHTPFPYPTLFRPRRSSAARAAGRPPRPPRPPPLPPFTDPWLLPESRPSRRRPGGRALRRWPAATAPRPTRPRARRRRPAAAAETREIGRASCRERV